MSTPDPVEPVLVRLDAESERPPAFTCGDGDIDEFFHKDSIEGATELLCVTYAWYENERPVAYFSVCNDAVKREYCTGSGWKRVVESLSRRKRYSSLPAVKIGRLGVSADVARTGVGSRILDYLKVWFTRGNKTGCRFIIVDAYKDPAVIAFYKKNGFLFLTADENENERTRIMYFDLIKFANRATAMAIDSKTPPR